MNLKQIENDILNSKFDDALQKIEDNEGEETLNYAYRSYISLSMNDQHSAEQFAKLVLEKEESTSKDPLIRAMAYFVEGTLDFVNGDLDESHSKLDKSYELTKTKETSNFVQNLQGDILNRIATIKNQSGNYKDAIELLEEALQIRKNLGLKSKIGGTTYNLGTIHFQSGDYVQAEKYLNETAELFEEIENNLGIAYCKMELGGIYQYQGKLDNALENFLEAHAMFKLYGSDTQIAWSLTDLGNIYQKLGEIEKSLHYYTKAIPLYEKFEDKRVVANHLRAMAISHRMQGNIQKSLELNNQALGMYQELNNSNYEARALFQIAQDYSELQNFSKAIEYTEAALVKFKNDNYHDFIARSLFLKLRCGFHIEREFKIDEIHKELEEIANGKNSTPLIKQIRQLAEALIEIHSNRFSSYSKALNILDIISQEEVRDIQYTNLANLMLLDIYVKELQLFYNQETLREINLVIDRIYALGKLQNSPQLEIQAHLVNSKIKLIERDYDLSVEFVSNAIEIAKDKGFDQWLQIASTMQTELQADVNRIKDLFEVTTDIDQLLQETGLDQFIGNLLKSNFSNLSLDIPYGISLIFKHGTSIHTEFFVSELNIDEQLLAGFITALSSFSKETFDSASLLEQIKIGDTQILLENIGDTMICYLYTGSSISAKYRIEKLVKLLEKDVNREKLRVLIEKSEMLSDTILMGEINEIFV